MLERIKSHFGVGSIRFSKANNCAIYSVQSVKDISNVIILNFDKFPLLTQKRADFELFKEVVDLINKKEHLTIEGLHKIVAIRGSINRGLSSELKRGFPDIVASGRPIVPSQKIMDPS